jgi:hypothetical protein
MKARLFVAFVSAAVAISFAGGTTAAPTPAQKCLSSKLKEMGKYDSCRLKAEAKAVTQGGAPDFSRCGTKLTQKFTAIEARGGCDQTGDQAAAQAASDLHSDEIFAILTGSPAPVCGNNTVEAGEQCDGTDLSGETCVTQGFASGTLACTAGCALDTSACLAASCGNGTLELGEQCDGTALNNFTCSHFGFAPTPAALACDGACNFDTSGCAADSCGNGTIEGFESCDGVDLNGSDCTTFGASGGTLACSAGCSYDFSGCTFTCGNGVADLTEECDGADLDFQSCVSLGFIGGTLACDVGCSFDTSACTATCGDNVQSEVTNEECDGTDLGSSSTCELLAYTSGTLGCTAGCLYDTSACVLDCDYLAQDCPGGDGCYLSFFSPGGCQPPGTSGPLQVCVAQNDCEARSYCVAITGGASVCLPFCDSSIGDADCPGGFNLGCLETDVPAEPDLGICVPF